MKLNVRQFINDWVPPAVVRGVKSLKAMTQPASFEFAGFEWPDNMTLSGWQANGVTEAREKIWGAFLQSMEGPHPFGISEVEFLCSDHVNIDVQNLYLSFGYCLGLACQGKQALTMLDWGGGTGNYFIIGKKLMPMIEFNYSSADLPAICEIGRKLLPDVIFYGDNGWHGKCYDFVFSSSALQYLEDWRPTLQALIQSSNKYLYVTRMPFVAGKSFVMLQRVKEYGTDYYGWVLNRQEFVGFVEQRGMKLVREFVNHTGPAIRNAPEQNLYMGFLFEK